MSLDNPDFTCADLGPNEVTLTVTDVNGNTSECSSTVSVEDNIPPTLTCQDITIELDAMGLATIAMDSVNNGSWDSCGIQRGQEEISIYLSGT